MQTAVIRLSDTKTSKRKSSMEYAVVESAIGVKLLRLACHSINYMTLVVNMKPKQAYVELKSLLTLFGLRALSLISTR